MWGNSSHVAELARHLQERFQNSAGISDVEINVLVCQSNHGEGTYDGVDWGAERAVEEVS
jgi:hypothetical protein